MSFVSPSLVVDLAVFSSAVAGAELEAFASWDILGYVDTVQCSVM